MAIYHFSAKLISRANGSSALASAAYRAAGRLYDQRLGRTHDFTNKAGVVHSEVLLPENAPEQWQDRATLWNAVEAAEKRVDAQLAREIEFAIPKELDQAEGIRLAREFVQKEFVERGMVADLNVHWDIGADGEAKPHAHVMLATRGVEVGDNGEAGFGAKVREWNRTELLQQWRERWAEHVNTRLAELDIDARVDHRSLNAQGIDLEPQSKIGPAASRMVEQGLSSERLYEHHAIARSNGEKLLRHPEIALDAITHQQSTFTRRDIAMIVHRHSDGQEQFDRVLAAVHQSPQLVALGKDGRGEDRFTSKAMLQTEQRLETATGKLAERTRNGVLERHRDVALARAAARDMFLSTEQRSAFEHVTGREGLSVVIGYAGTGKSAMLGVAREAWESAGYRVQGLALSGIAAENLESGSQIPSRTIASLEHQWSKGEGLLTSRDVLVVDEAGMIGTRQMERLLSEAEQRGAKVVLVGDPEQLQAIEAGAAFRSISERHGGVEITAIRRQREDWQRDATRQLAIGRTGEALNAYEQAGHVHVAESRELASVGLIERWDRDRVQSPDASRIILTHTNDEVRSLNEAARERLHVRGNLGPEVGIHAERGKRMFASGDRIMFLKNERGLGVKNGSLGTVQSLNAMRMQVLLDDGRSVAFDLKDYNQVDHGYAATIHKAQGMTVDRVHVLATPGLDRHASYVALSRHRDRVDLHYGSDDFADRQRLVRALSRDRGKDMASDYGGESQHSIEKVVDRTAGQSRTSMRAQVVKQAPKITAPQRQKLEPPTPKRGMFEGLKLTATPMPEQAPAPSALERAVERYGRAAADIVRMWDAGQKELPHQAQAFRKAGQELDAIRPNGERDLRTAMNADRGLIDQSANGRTAAAIRAMVLEGEIRTQNLERADRFVTDWQRQARQLHLMQKRDDYIGIDKARSGMAELAKSLERDPQLESLLRNRVKELGIGKPSGVSISDELLGHPALSRSRGLGR